MFSIEENVCCALALHSISENYYLKSNWPIFIKLYYFVSHPFTYFLCVLNIRLKTRLFRKLPRTFRYALI